MLAIKFIKDSYQLKKSIITGNFTGNALEELEAIRPEIPPVFQLETTNVCNMKCVMCPRTDHMNRKLGTMSVNEFENVIKQLEPHSQEDWALWEEYSKNEFLKNTLAYDEDFFYFMICAKTLILHGFGEPILDKTLADKIKLASDNGFPTYFSMNPVNIRLEKIREFAEAGLDYLKLSLEGLDNETQQIYRGVTDKNFNITLKKIFDVIELFQKENFKTKIILTRLSFRHDPEGDEEYISFWKNYPVMAYIKNQHNRWLYEEEKAGTNTAEYLQRYCEFPWSSVSVLHDGTVVPCPLDYEGELSMGNIHEKSLEEIWNSNKYAEFRKRHATGNFPEGHFCKKKCDYKQLYEFTGKNK